MTRPPQIPMQTHGPELLDDLVLFGTQGGGLAQLTPEGKYIWFELPSWMSELPDGDSDKAKIGDPIPEEWDLIPATSAAQRSMAKDEDVSTTTVYGRAYAHFGNHEMAREATEMYPGDFI